jgi:hypothetical protein
MQQIWKQFPRGRMEALNGWDFGKTGLLQDIEQK